MARTSSTGLPFLIRRPDTGKFAYHRTLSAELAAFVTGVLILPWTTGMHTLSGRPTIKISLKTGDDDMARVRWNRVHEQVEGLVQMGRVLGHEEAERRRCRREVDGLPSGAVSTIAAQAGHDLLAEHDRTWIDPTFTSPLTSVVLNLMRKASRTRRGGDVDAARRLSTDLLLRQAKRSLVERDPGLVDRDIEVVDAGLDPGLFDLEALKGGRVARLTPEQVAAVESAPVTSRIPSEVNARLAENGLELPEGHPDRRVLALALLRAKVRSLEAVQAREVGAASETPPRPAVRAAPAMPIPTAPPLRERWIKDVRPSPKQADDNGNYVQYFIDLHGDQPVDQIAAPMVVAFLDLLQRCPRNVPHALRRARLQDRVAWGENAEDLQKPRLARQTVNSKGLGSISAAMTQAVKHGYITVNPCAGLALALKAGDQLARHCYDLNDLKKIFATKVYEEPSRIAKSGAGDAARWLPLLGLFTGARLEELGQLLVGDVKLKAGVQVLNITDLPDESEGGNLSQLAGKDGARAAPTSPAKSVKSAAARRIVPIHLELVRCGFLAFVEQQRAAGHVRLFPELRDYRGRLTKEWSKYWARHTDRYVTTSPSKTFHSFRHLFVARLRELEIDKDIIKALVGHSNSDVTIGYGQTGGSAFDIAALNRAAQAFSVDGLDLLSLHQPAG